MVKIKQNARCSSFTMKKKAPVTKNLKPRPKAKETVSVKINKEEKEESHSDSSYEGGDNINLADFKKEFNNKIKQKGINIKNDDDIIESNDNVMGDNIDDNMENDENSDQDDGYDDSDSEGDAIFEENEENNSSKKRKIQNDSKEAKVTKKARRSNNKHVKPPTAEEMRVLKETENLFQSNLFRLQIKEMLVELKPKKSVKKFITPWFESLKSTLLSLEDGDQFLLNDVSWLEKLNVKLPISTKIESQKGSFTFIKPIDLFIIGSHDLSCALGPQFGVDVAMVMPKSFMLHNDNLNQRYHLKRALYLCHIASKLSGSKLLLEDSKPHFAYLSDDPHKPMLVLKPNKFSRFIQIRLYSIPEDNTFHFKRFLPSHNNVRPEWWGIKIETLPPTPMYNASILEDMVMKINHDFKREVFSSNNNLTDAFVLLRVWFRQRELTQAYCGFNSHIIAMMLVYLMKNRQINKFLSSYQIARRIWLYLTETDWTTSGPTLCDSQDNLMPTIEEFHVYYDVVFIDSSGYFNMAARVDKHVYLEAKEEAKLAMELLDNSDINGFKALFLTKMPFLRQLDTIISFRYEVLEETVTKRGDIYVELDYCGNPLPQFLNLVTSILEKGLGDRMKEIRLQAPSTKSWDLNIDPPKIDLVKIGILVNPTAALSLIDKGPEPNSSEAAEFREFWGGKCELRRFKDGTVSESVVWGGSEITIEERRNITSHVISYLMVNKLGIIKKNFQILSKPFLDVIKSPRNEIDLAREETCRQIHLAYEDLSRQLRDLPDLPLSIVSVHCISPVYRFTEPFPPVRPMHYSKVMERTIKHPVKGTIFPMDNKVGKHPPQYIAPIDCIVQMAMTQKWPADIQAGRRLIMAFNTAIVGALRQTNNLSCQLTTDYIVVNKDNYVFRLFLGYSREIALLKMKISEDGVKHYRDTPLSLELEKKFINLPKLTGALYRLSEEYPSFGAVTCLAKRWLSSLLIDKTHFPEVVVELLMAHIFLKPQPYQPPFGILPAFLRFLDLLCNSEWSSLPIIVNFNSLLSGDEIKEIEEAFTTNRKNFPPLFLATPYDKSGSLWTKDDPSASILDRVMKLSRASLNILEGHIFEKWSFDAIRKIFQPPMAVYDAVIKVRPPFQFRKEESFLSQGKKHSKQIPILYDTTELPILEFNPVDLFLADIRQNYGKHALFFHDTHGGMEIGVLFYPKYLEELEFKSSHIPAKKPCQENGKILLKPHLDTIFEGIKVLGNGMVESIELKRETS